MSIVVVGAKSQSMLEEHAEKLAIAVSDLPKVLREVSQRGDVEEVVVLSTCLRTEIYAVVDRFHPGVTQLQEWLGHYSGLPSEKLADELVVAYDDAAVAHLFEVASGIDSAVLGEGEVLGQVKRAFQAAQKEGVLGPVLRQLFKHAIEAGKKARSETSIASGITSMAHAAVELAKVQSNGSLKGKSVLVVGAGEMGTGLAEALSKRASVEEVLIANRTKAKAVQLANNIGAKPLPMAEIPKALESVDVVFLSTVSPKPLLTADSLREATSKRSSPLVIVDTSIPHNVESDAKLIDGIVVLDLSDVSDLAEVGLAHRSGEIASVRKLLGKELLRYQESVAHRGAAPVISALRQRGEDIRQGVLSNFESELSQLDKKQREVVEAMTKRLIATYLHEPTVRLKDASGSAKGERLTEAIRHLFDI
ncbi:MAG: glutamyl-tRNA reductase [Acidimicrobiales bacterium]|nr:glutamyl-tRNA reductase [Acidimicrobiales bacterium]